MGAGAKCKQPEYEFMGPWIGPLGIVLGLPAVCYWLVNACNSRGCLALARPLQLPGLPPSTPLFTLEAAAAAAAWVSLQVRRPTSQGACTELCSCSCGGPGGPSRELWALGWGASHLPVHASPSPPRAMYGAAMHVQLAARVCLLAGLRLAVPGEAAAGSNLELQCTSDR